MNRLVFPLLCFIAYQTYANPDSKLIDLAGALNSTHQINIKGEIARIEHRFELRTLLSTAYAFNCAGFEERIRTYDLDIRLHLNCETHEFRLELSDKAFEAMRPEHQSRTEFIAQTLAGHHPEKTSPSRFYHMLEILRSLEQAFFKKQTRIKYGLEVPDKLEFKIQVKIPKRTKMATRFVFLTKKKHSL